jgi:hypothetical protein
MIATFTTVLNILKCCDRLIGNLFKIKPKKANGAHRAPFAFLSLQEMV